MSQRTYVGLSRGKLREVEASAQSTITDIRAIADQIQSEGRGTVELSHLLEQAITSLQECSAVLSLLQEPHAKVSRYSEGADLHAPGTLWLAIEDQAQAYAAEVVWWEAGENDFRDPVEAMNAATETAVNAMTNMVMLGTGEYWDGRGGKRDPYGVELEPKWEDGTAIMKFWAECQAYGRAAAENSARESRGLKPWSFGGVRLFAEELHGEWCSEHLDPLPVHTRRPVNDTMPLGLTHLDHSEQERER